MAKRPTARGFTLIEVMIVVAIIAILAGVALPAYQDYIRRGQLPESFTSLSDYRVKLEQYYQDNRKYGAAGVCGTGMAWAAFTATKYFSYSCVSANGDQTYTLTATGSAGKAVGHVYTLSSAGNKATTSFKGAASTKTCWLARGDEC